LVLGGSFPSFQFLDWFEWITRLEAPTAPENKSGLDFGGGGLGTLERLYTGEISVPWWMIS